MVSHVAIQRAIEGVVYANNNRAFVKQPLTDAVREACHGLAYALEAVPGPSDLKGITDDELAHLYATARKNQNGALGLARTIRNRLEATEHNPLLDDAPKAHCPWCGAAEDHTALGQCPKDTPPPSQEPRTEAKEETGTPTPSVDLEALDGRIIELSAATAKAVSDERLSDALNGLEDLVAKEAMRAVEAVQPLSLIVTLPEAVPVPLGTVHWRTPKLIEMVAAGVNVYLHGPAGSGKTTGAQKVAEAFKLPFYFAAKVESEYLLLGFRDAQGNTVRTQFREAYEHGGVFLFDEMDASAPGAIVAINAALANGFCPFPDGTIQRHKDFKCIGAGNTVLTGANRKYTGRSQMDAASIDRFAFLDWGYDAQLEIALATNKDWGLYVQRVRAAIAKRGLDHLVTPRATIDGCKLLNAGMDWEDVETSVIWKGLDADTVEAIKREAI
jgi:cobaltochelatase CobS